MAWQPERAGLKVWVKHSSPPLQLSEEWRGKQMFASCTRGIQGGGLVDLLGLCTWLGGVVENSTGMGVASGGVVEVDDDELP